LRPPIFGVLKITFYQPGGTPDPVPLRVIPIPSGLADVSERGACPALNALLIGGPDALGGPAVERDSEEIAWVQKEEEVQKTGREQREKKPTGPSGAKSFASRPRRF
jgi:hypothetical protein